MAKAFSVMSWNIEHLKGKRPERIKAIVDTLKDEKPDIFAIYEVEGKTVYNDLLDKMPKYTFHITEGPQTQEILVGVKDGISAFFTQKVTFKTGNPSLRPGALLSIRIDNVDYSLLFLHLKSLTKPVGLGLRDDQFERVGKLKKILDTIAANNKRANFIALGDFNTMGMDYRGKDHDIPASVELDKLDMDFKKQSIKMRRLPKTAPNTWNNGSGSSYKPSNLDHVLASDHMTFNKWDNKNPVNEPDSIFVAGKSEVDVRGWVDEDTISKQDEWINKFSDHSYLYFVVNKV